MNLRPLDDRIVVEPSEAEQTTASGLVIPDTAKEKPQQGVVLAVGPGRWSDDEGEHFALDIKVGDTEITHGGKDLLILTSRDVLAVVEK
jgi:chaperonin GroES